MSLKLDAQIFNCNYGLRDIVSQLVTLSLQVGAGPKSCRDLILVIDVSLSMKNYIDRLKYGIIALFNNLNPGTGFRLIIFSDTAQEIWPNQQDVSLIECINREVYARHRTNLSDGIKLAQSKIDPERPTWIVIMTDGKANLGTHCYPDEVKNLVESFPANSTIIALGFGNHYCIKTLRNLGSYTHLADCDSMVLSFGGVVNEINTAWGFNTRIIPPKGNDKCRTIIGTTQIGSLVPERNFIFGYLPFGDSDQTEVEKEIGLTYYDTEKLETVKLHIPIVSSDQLPESMIRSYYQASKARLLKILCDGSVNQRQINFIRDRLKLWDPVLAETEIKEIEAFLSQKDSIDYYSLNGYIEDIMRQSSFNREEYQSGSQRETSEKVVDGYRSQLDFSDMI